MSIGKMPENSLAKYNSAPSTLQQAVRLLADRNGINDLLRTGSYEAVGNRIATFILEMQKYRKKDILTGEDFQEVEQGITRIFGMSGLEESEKPHLLQTVRERFEARSVSLAYLEKIKFEGE